MGTFEEGFGAVEAAAGHTAAEAAALAKAAKQLLKAAQDGNIGQLRRQSIRLTELLSSVTGHVERASASWPFDVEDERAYLEQRFGAELRAEADRIGLNVTPRDERLVCSPSIIRVSPADRAVTIDGRKRSAIRPSKLAADLHAIQQAGPRGNPQRFLEALHKAYRILAPAPADSLIQGGQVVALAKVYSLLTTLPGSGRQYSRTDFARDLYVLDSSAVDTTRSGGARVSFLHSTAARSGKGAFSFADRAGNLITYSSIRFTEVG